MVSFVYFKKKIKKKHWKNILFLSIIFVLAFGVLWAVANDVKSRYESLLSVTIYDKNGVPISIKENAKGHYVSPLTQLPNDFAGLLIQKEDRYFYYHFGINPFSTFRALYRYATQGKADGSSTITQQLAKNILFTELERTLYNKLREIVYAIGIETFFSKDEILLLYANTVYLGNQVQGFQTASYAYFEKPLRDTTYSEQVALLATLSYPNARNPWEKSNVEYAEALHRRVSPDSIFIAPKTSTTYSFQKKSYFELRSAGVTCEKTCHTTIDDTVTEQIRNILQRHIATEWKRGARNGAVVVLDPQTSEILALVGSVDPKGIENGNQINMTLQPRPIGSTVKPLIYLKGFMEGLRPYTLVDDREYKYAIATGFPLYPKNYDGQYHGVVTLHEALSNSLNVPSVKVLEYIGLENFYTFLGDQLSFTPIQEFDSYQYGIALGGLEMDLLTLTHYFTLFPRMGTIAPLRILKDSTENFSLPPQSNIQTKKTVAEKKYVQLVHTIISDRLTGVNQFGLKGNLNIEAKEYGLKTGTSRDFHDSWVVGYTPDFVVGVWIGNTENEPLKQVSGQSGAGAVWHDVMNFLLETPLNTRTVFDMKDVRLFPIQDSTEWGLHDDTIAEHRNLLLSDILITSPYVNDSYEYFEGMTIPLKASKAVTWSVNGKNVGTGTVVEFHPESIGRYEILATEAESLRREIIMIQIVAKDI
jgi:membrane peptidoglycan carboxypeptidase